MWLVAEIGCSHEGNIELAKIIIKQCAEAGFTHVKLQKRTPELCVPKDMWHVKKQTPYGEMDYIEYRRMVELDKTQYALLVEYSQSHNVELFASVSDIQAAKEMKEIGMEIIKIPSPKIIDDELIEYCAIQFRTKIISTGMSTEMQIDKAIALLQPDIICHSVAEYPTKPENLNLGYIKWLQLKYGECIIGYSGHDMMIEPVLYAVWNGCDYIERHVCPTRQAGWISDNTLSLEFGEYSDYIGKILIEYAKKERYDIVSASKRIHDIVKMLPDIALHGNEARKVLECEKEKMKQLRGVQ